MDRLHHYTASEKSVTKLYSRNKTVMKMLLYVFLYNPMFLMKEQVV